MNSTSPSPTSTITFMNRTTASPHLRARELVSFLGLFFLLLVIVHSCTGCSANPNPPQPITVLPIPTTPGTDTCVQGCTQRQTLCGDTLTSCLSACEAAVQQNLAPWVYQYQGPTCWAAATSISSMLKCAGVTTCNSPTDAGGQ
jgi:hypothetical protein